jgi:hypothetical protein
VEAKDEIPGAAPWGNVKRVFGIFESMNNEEVGSLS